MCSLPTSRSSILRAPTVDPTAWRSCTMTRWASYSILSDGNALMGVVCTGAARAAFELALAYAHERKQGGVPIIRHQSVAYRLFHMYRKVEAARALSRRALIYNYTQPVPAMH